jgi:hypothetical protein
VSESGAIAYNAEMIELLTSRIEPQTSSSSARSQNKSVAVGNVVPEESRIASTRETVRDIPPQSDVRRSTQNRQQRKWDTASARRNRSQTPQEQVEYSSRREESAPAPRQNKEVADERSRQFYREDREGFEARAEGRFRRQPRSAYGRRERESEPRERNDFGSFFGFFGRQD